MIKNYHTHTVRCNHAQGSEEEYIQSAIQAGFDTLGFSDHAPINVPDFRSTFRMEPYEYHDYTETILSLRERYAGRIKIYLGLEVEYYPDIFDDVLDFLLTEPLDYMILGQHFTNNEYDGTYAGSTEANNPAVLARYTEQTCEAMRTGLFTYLAHPDLIRYDTDKPEYAVYMRRICETAKECNMPLEINLFGLMQGRHYPCKAFFRIAAECGNDCVIGYDAHSPECIYSEQAKKAYDRALSMVTELNLHLITPTLIKPVRR